MPLLIQQSLELKLNTRLKVYKSCETASSYVIVSCTLLRVLLYQECRSIQLLSTRLIINYSLATLVEPSYVSSCNYAITSLIKAKTSTSTILITIPTGVYTCLVLWVTLVQESGSSLATAYRLTCNRRIQYSIEQDTSQYLRRLDTDNK